MSFDATGEVPRFCPQCGAPAEGWSARLRSEARRLVDAFAVWGPDLVVGRFVPLDPATTRSFDEGTVS